MPKYRLHKGMHLELCGREYVIERRLRGGDFQIKDVATNEFKPIPEDKLFDAWFNGELRFPNEKLDSTLAQRKANRTYIQELSLLDSDPKKKKIKAAFHRRRKYVIAVNRAQLKQLNKSTVKPIIDEVSKTAGPDSGPDPKPPDWKTLIYRWFLPYMRSGEDFRVLVPAYEGRGNTNSKFTGIPKKKHDKFTIEEKQKAEQVAEIIVEVKDEKLIDGQRHSLSSIHDTIIERIIETNEERAEDDKLPIPHKSSVCDFLDRKLSDYDREVLRRGRRFADLEFRENKQAPIPTRPLERIEIDHTLTDLMVIDTDVMLPIGRPHFTSAIDVLTKMGLGFFVSFYYPGYLAAMHCLKHAILPKTYVRERYPSVKHSWDCYGLPENAFLDNAPEFHDDSLEEASIQLGFNIEYGPKGEPWYRATVERYFGTLNTNLLHRQPGTTFSNILDKGDYNPEKNALISFDDFMEIAHVFMIDIYPREKHRGLRVDKFSRNKLRDFEAVPARLWEKAIAEFPPSLPPHRDELLVLLGKLDYRVISSSGIEYECLFYNNERLQALRRTIPTDEKVALKIDLDDLSSIYVIEPNATYIKVPALNQEYTFKLSLWQHKKIKEFARRIAKDSVNIYDLIRAKQIIQEIVERSWKSSKKSGARKQMARFKGIKQEDYSLNLESEAEPTYVQGDIKIETSILLLNPEASALNGISDIAGAYLPAEGLQMNEHNNHTESSSSDLKFASEVKNSYGRKLTSKKKEGAKPSQSRSPSAGTNDHTRDKSSNAMEDDEELDMTGFSSNFSLPTSRRKARK
jgi:putative transposase